MTLLLRLTTIGAFVGLLTVGQMWLPPFPDAFAEWLTMQFTRMLYLDTWLPVRLTLNLWLVIMGVEAAVYLWQFGQWFKNFVLGDGRG